MWAAHDCAVHSRSAFPSSHMTFRKPIAALLAAAATSWGATSLAQPATEARTPTERPSGKVTKPPKLLKFFQAPYPESERASGAKASVVLALSIGGDGKVADATVAQ